MTNATRPRWASAARGAAALVLIGGTALGAAACGSDNQSGGGSAASGTSASATSPLSVDAFATAAAAPGTMLIDVRTPAEYAAGHLAGAVNIDVQGSSFTTAVGELDPTKSYAVYCHSGNRSAVAVSYLLDHGFTHVAELGGGIAAWEAAGKPVSTS